MNKPFGAKSIAIRETLTPKLQLLVDTVNSRWQCTLFSGGRTKAEQVKLVKQGLSKTMQSKHVMEDQVDKKSHAVDWGPDPVRWDDPQYKLDLIYFHGFVMAVARELGIRVRFGGDWNRNNRISDESFQDVDHTELEDA